MNSTDVVLSDAAALDILEQADWYEEQSGSRLAKRWERAVASGLIFLARNPLSGAPCRFRSTELQDIRRIPISGFPKHLMFYRVSPAGVLVLRIVHGARDLETLFLSDQ